MIVRKLRLQRGWSQEHLSELAGVSTRTIQRLERGQKPSFETSRALASVFDVSYSTFSKDEETKMNYDENLDDPTATVSEEEKHAMDYVRGIKEFYNHLVIFVVLAGTFVGLALLGKAGEKTDFILLGALGWGLGLAIHGAVAFEVFSLRWFGADWEKKAVEKRLQRKL